MKSMNRVSTLENSKAMLVSANRGSYPKKFINYFLLLLIFIFFALPLTGLSLHYYKFGAPPRLMGFLSLFWSLIKGLFNLF